MSGFPNDLSADQRASLDTLRAALTPAHWAEHGLAAADLVLWRVDLGAIPSDAAAALSPGQTVVLLKFLRARNFVVADALAMLTACLKWRRDFGVAALADATFPASYAALGDVHGRERASRCPVTYNYYGGFDADKMLAEEGNGPEVFLRWRVQLMERAMALLDLEREPGVEAVMQVHDYAGASMRPAGAMRAVTKQVIATFADNYPECLSRKLFVNVPKVMESLFAAVSIFSPERTRAKFRMVGAGSTRAALWQWIDATELPERYGGSALVVPNDTKWIAVGARSAFTVWTPVTKGQTVHYHVATGGLDVGVAFGFAASLPKGVTDPASEAATKAKPEDAPKVQRVEVHAGSAVAPNDGFAYLYLDNSYSLLTSKDVRFVVKAV
ncbi:Non-classical phosphatidylinositol transfer protein (PITP) [Blastocladiella emersonii ATCC 22665]|nr:Non-classical phosphatidylinositol transfer protein (PITP) [Blastocladiella emersonii ATCC 22665]